MMSSYICRHCRARLLQRKFPCLSPQWQPRATFVSFQNGKPIPEQQKDKSKNKPEKQKDRTDSEGIGDPEANGHESFTIRTHLSRHVPALDSSGRVVSRRNSRYSKYVPTTAPDQILDIETIPTSDEPPSGPIATYRPFQSSLPPKRTRARVDNSTQPSPDADGMIPHGSGISQHLKEGRLDEAWALFEKGYPSQDSPALPRPSFIDIGYVTGNNTVFDTLLRTITWKFGEGSNTPVSPTTVLHRFELLNISKGDNWRNAISILTDSLLHSVASKDDRAGALLEELLSVWRLLFQAKGKVDLPIDTLDTTWQSIPPYENLLHITLDTTVSRDFNRRLQLYLPRSLSNVQFGFSALAIFHLLGGHNELASSFSDEIRIVNAPFVRLVKELLPLGSTQSTLIHTEHSTYFKKLPKSFRDDLKKQFEMAPSLASILLRAQSQDPDAGPLAEIDTATYKEQLYLDRIERITFDQANLHKLDRLWNEIIQDYTNGDRVAVPPMIYNALLPAFMTMQAPQRTVEVWNHMMKHGVTPDQKSWNAILSGCVKAKDIVGLNAMWTRMIQSGIIPDLYSWTTRIHGLISLNNVNDGFAALDEMSRQWLAGENNSQRSSTGQKKSDNNKPSATDENPYPKPAIQVINAAASAIVNLPSKARVSFQRRCGLVKRVLEWAGHFSIKPEAITYNILVKLYMDGGDFETVTKLLKQMELENIVPDIATYSLLIRGTFQNEQFAKLSDEEQTDKVLAIFADLESGGLRINSHIYHTAIDRLLKIHKNMEGVRAVINFMRSRNMAPSALVYTSLFTHYFQQSPPDIEAVDTLWNQIMSNKSAATDRTMFDRLLEGYGRAGEVGKMMAVLTTMGTHGKLPGWEALTVVIRALVNAGEWDRARSIVDDCRHGTGVASVGVEGTRSSRPYFFNVAAKLGLVEDEMEAARMEQGRAEETQNQGIDEVSIGSTVHQEGWDFLAARNTDALKEDEPGEGDNGSIGGIPL